MLALAFLALGLVTASVAFGGIKVFFKILDQLTLATDARRHTPSITEKTRLWLLSKEPATYVLRAPRTVEEETTGLAADQESRVAEVEFLTLVQAHHADPVFALALV